MGRIKMKYSRLGIQARQYPIVFFMFFCFLLSFLTMRQTLMTSSCTMTARSSFAPGIGFDLTAGYGTAVIRNHNGSFDNVAKVEMNSEYKEMMKRLSLESSQHPSPPYKSLGQVFRDEPRQILRAIRRRLGFPASKDVGLISELIQRLRTKTEMKLGQSICSAVVSFSYSIAIYEEDISDALKYAGLEPLTDRSLQLQPHQLSAASSGAGLGLCEHYENFENCKQEEEDLPYEQVLAISYTEDALEVSLAAMKSAYHPFKPENHHLIDWALGESSLDSYSRADAYWIVVRRRILELSYSEYPNKHITAVMLLGESAQNEEFQRNVIDALQEFQDDLPVIHRADPLYLAARGAAEYAERVRE